ncbi:LuxR C-terminal-related transcriptional regulator [Nocardia sp. NPDC055053]
MVGEVLPGLEPFPKPFGTDYPETMVAGWSLTGRAEEIAELWEATAPNTPGCVVAGSAGVGKTRLATEIVSRWRSEGRPCRFFVATRSARSVPLGAFAEVSEDFGTDPLRRVQSMVEALTTTTGVGPGLLVIDDANLLDEQSALVVHQIVRSAKASVLLTLRHGELAPDALSGLWKDQLLLRLDLQPLSQLETAGLLTQALGGRVESSTAARMWQFTRGNVLHLRYLVEGELASGLLTCRHGVWVWDGRPSISPPLAELVAASIARQPQMVSSVLDVLSVVDPIEIDVLTAVCGPQSVETAVAAGLITIDRGGSAVSVRLVHPLLGEVRRAASLPARLQSLRGRVVQELHIRNDDCGPVERVRRAVLMCESDLTADPAVLVEAAHAALRLSDPVTAERLARHAVASGGGFRAHLVHVSGLIETQQFQEAVEVATALERLPLPPRVHVPLTLARMVAEATLAGRPESGQFAAIEHDATAAGLTCLYDASVAFTAAFHTDPVAAVESGRKALGTTAPMDKGFEVLAAVAVTGGAAMLGDYTEMTTAAEHAYELCRTSDKTATMHFLNGCFHLMGLCTAGYLAQADELVARLTREPLDFPLAYSYWSLLESMVATARGDLAAAVRKGQEALAVRLPFESTWIPTAALLQQIIAVSMQGEAISASSLLSEYRPPGPAAEALRPRNQHQLARAWVAAATGVTSRAIALAVDAADMARSQQFFAHEVVCRQTAVQFGDRHQTARLTELRALVEGPRVAVAADHAEAVERGDSQGLKEAAVRYDEFGDRIAAADAAAQASQLFRAKAFRGAALTTAAAARRSASVTGAATPALRTLHGPAPLTARQREIIALVAVGMSNQQIARELVMSVRTVEGHLLRACQRTGVNSRNELTQLLERPR